MIEKIQNYVNRARGVSYIEILDMYPKSEKKVLKNIISSLNALKFERLISSIKSKIPFSPFIKAEITISGIRQSFKENTGKDLDYYQWNDLDKAVILNDLLIYHSLIQNAIIFPSVPFLNIDVKIFLRDELSENIRISFFKDHYTAECFSGNFEAVFLKRLLSDLTGKRPVSISEKEGINSFFVNIESLVSDKLISLFEREYEKAFFVDDNNYVEVFEKVEKFKIKKVYFPEFYLYGNFSYERIRDIMRKEAAGVLKYGTFKNFLERFKEEPI